MKKASLIFSSVAIIAMVFTGCGGSPSYENEKASTEVIIEKEETSQKEIIEKEEIIKEVIIGEQVWMAENLNVDKFRNGDPISEAKSAKEWNIARTEGKPAWCYYDNVPANGEKYGKLYNGYAVFDSRGLCPEGWHIPSYDEWSTLTEFLGGYRVAGKKMKATDSWADYNGESGNGTNESGFSGLPGGNRRGANGAFGFIGGYGYWWSSSQHGNYAIYYWRLDNIHDQSRDDYSDVGYGHSVRCVRD